MAKQTLIIDLRKIDGVGDCPCPKCGTNIDPERDDSYQVLECKTEHSLTIECAKCKASIKIVGLEA